VQIADHPGLTIEELRRRIGLSHSTVVRLLDRLAARGLVRRDRNQQDARTAGLRLTGQGQALARSVLAARKEVTAAITTRLTPDRQRDLESLLDDMLADLPVTPGHASLLCRVCCLRECPADRCPVELRYQELLSSLATSRGWQGASRRHGLRPGRRRGRRWRRWCACGPAAGDTGGHDVDHRPVQEDLVMFGEPTAVADAAAVFHDPAERPLHHPAAGQHLEGVQVIGPLDDLQDAVQRAGLPT
jgi:MarR family transcriptional regulator, negative regulator of the multidrug operon emrRAB